MAEDLFGTDNTSIELVRKVLHQGQSDVELTAGAGNLVPVVSRGSIVALAAELQTKTGLRRTEDSIEEWECSGYISGLKRISNPTPFGFLMDVFSDDHSAYFEMGEILEIDRGDRDLKADKHYLMLTETELRLGRYDPGRHALVSESTLRRSRLQVFSINDQCHVVGRVVRSIVERTFD